MKRREFIEKVLVVGGLACIQPWQLLKMLNVKSIADAQRIVEQWDVEAEASPLTKNYVTNAGTVLCDSRISALILSQQTGGNGTWQVSNNVDPLFLKDGATNVLKIDVTGGSQASTYVLDWVINTTLLPIGNFTFPYHISSILSGWSVDVLVAETSSYANRYIYGGSSTFPNDVQRIGWNFVVLDRATPTSTVGSPNPANTFQRVRIQLQSPANQSGTFYIGPVKINRRTRPKVVFTFDHAYTSHYTVAYPYLAARGLVGSIAVQTGGSNAPGTANNVTVAQLLEMQRVGWSMHSHSVNHPDLTSMSVSEAISEMRTAQETLDTWRLTSGKKHVMYPGGTTNDAIDAGMITLGYTSGSTTVDTVEKIWDGLVQPMRVRRQNADSTITIGTMRSRIDSAIKYGACIVFYTHDIVNGVVDQNDMEIATFQSLVDYAYRYHSGNVLDIVSMTEFINSFQTVRKQKHAV